MRKIIALIALCALTGTAFSGDFLGLKDWKFDGSLEVLGNQANNETDANDGNKDSRGNTITRMRLGADMGITEDVTGRVELTRNGESGTHPQYGDGATTAQNELDSILVQNAYIDIAGFLSLDSVRLGRQYVGRPGDLLVFAGAVNDDLLSVASLDALVVKKSFGPVDALFVTGKANEDDGIPGSGTDTDADAGSAESNITYGILSSDKLVKSDVVSVPLEIGYYQGTDANLENTPSDNATLSIIDLRAGLKALDNKLSVMAEYAMNGGQLNTGGGTKQDYKGNAMTLTAAWDDEDLGFGVKGLLANASGDDTADSEDKSFHDFAASDFRFGEILSNSNTFGSAVGLGAGLDTGIEGPGLNIMGLGGYYVLPVMEKKIKLKADYFIAKINEPAPGADDGIGNELDLAVNYAHSENLTASAGYAMLMPEDALTGGGSNPDDNITKLWAKLSLKWGDQE
jgi:hypothetical protein